MVHPALRNLHLMIFMGLLLLSITTALLPTFHQGHELSPSPPAPHSEDGVLSNVICLSLKARVRIHAICKPNGQQNLGTFPCTYSIFTIYIEKLICYKLFFLFQNCHLCVKHEIFFVVIFTF